MRVLHVVPSYVPAWRYGGPVRSVHGLCKALARLGHDVHVFTTNIDGVGCSAVPLGLPVNVDGVTVRYFRSPTLRRLYWSPAMTRALERHAGTFDLLHLHSVYLWPTTAAARAARRKHVPYVVTPRGMLVGEMIRRKSRLLKSAWIRLFERRNIAGAAMIHFTSRIEAEEAAALGLSLPATCVVANAIEDDDFLVPHGRDGSGVDAMPDRPFLLFVGRISPEKGLERLISALSRVSECMLVIAGNDEIDHASVLQTLAARLGIADRVSFVGPVYDERKRGLMKRAAALVLPSFFESFGNVVIEAMAVGCPVIVTPEVGAADLVRRSGAGLVVKGDPASLAAGIRSMMKDPLRRREMGEIGRAAAATVCTWDAIAREMSEVYGRILLRSPSERGV